MILTIEVVVRGAGLFVNNLASPMVFSPPRIDLGRQCGLPSVNSGEEDSLQHTAKLKTPVETQYDPVGQTVQADAPESSLSLSGGRNFQTLDKYKLWNGTKLWPPRPSLYIF